jgi:hypothetical protein
VQRISGRLNSPFIYCYCICKISGPGTVRYKAGYQKQLAGFTAGYRYRKMKMKGWIWKDGNERSIFNYCHIFHYRAVPVAFLQIFLPVLPVWYLIDNRRLAGNPVPIKIWVSLRSQLKQPGTGPGYRYRTWNRNVLVWSLKVNKAFKLNSLQRSSSQSTGTVSYVLPVNFLGLRC